MQNSRDVDPYYNSGYEYQVGSMHLPLSLLPGHIFWRQSQTTNDRTDRLEYAPVSYTHLLLLLQGCYSIKKIALQFLDIKR